MILKPKYTKHDIRKELVHAAYLGITIYYSTIAQKLNIPKSQVKEGYDETFYTILEQIGGEEMNSNRPLLNSLVVGKRNGLPGGRFYSWYMENKNDKIPWSKKAHFDFASKCQKECFEYWRAIPKITIDKFCETIERIYP